MDVYCFGAAARLLAGQLFLRQMMLLSHHLSKKHKEELFKIGSSHPPTEA